jgi:hypothetical protein
VCPRYWRSGADNKLDTKSSDIFAVGECFGVVVRGRGRGRGEEGRREGVMSWRWKYVHLVLLWRKVDWWRMWDSFSFSFSELDFRFRFLEIGVAVGEVVEGSGSAGVFAERFGDVVVAIGAEVAWFETGSGARIGAIVVVTVCAARSLE